MRWTRQRWTRDVIAGRVSRERSNGALTRDAARGRRSRVVLTPRRRRQVCGGMSTQPGADSLQSANDGDNKARSPGRARRKPLKPLRAGMPGVPVDLWWLHSCATNTLHTRLRVRRAPGISHALYLAKGFAKTRGHRAAGMGSYIPMSLRGAKRRSNPFFLCGLMDCFAEPVIGRAFARPVGSQ